jgi:hydroxymethylbilane synthase
MIHQKKMIKKIRIGTRSSPLALWQADFIKKKIERHFPDIQLPIVYIKTQGDRDQISSLTKVGGQGIFTKKIEQSLIDKKIDIAVHSLKDLPTEMPNSLALTAIPERGSVFDVFIGLKESGFNQLRQGATIACGSIRRRAQLLALRPDLNFADLRGNIETRLKKLKENQYDGIIMAEAAIIRLNLKEINYYRFNYEEMLPAVGQGAIGIQARKIDSYLEPVLISLNDRDTNACVSAERAFLRRLDSSCQFPVAAYANMGQGELILNGLVSSADGKTILRDKITGDASTAQDMGIALAENLIAMGALKLLKGE